MRKSYLIAGIATAAVAIGCGTSSPSSTPQDSQRLNDNANGGSSVSASTPPKLIIAGDWEVGKKEDLKANVITAGTYVITTPDNGLNCYWATVKSFDGNFESIIANGNVDPGTTARVIVKSSYAGLHLQGDCLATKKKVSK